MFRAPIDIYVCMFMCMCICCARFCAGYVDVNSGVLKDIAQTAEKGLMGREYKLNFHRVGSGACMLGLCLFMCYNDVSMVSNSRSPGGFNVICRRRRCALRWRTTPHNQ